MDNEINQKTLILFTINQILTMIYHILKSLDLTGLLTRKALKFHIELENLPGFEP